MRAAWSPDESRYLLVANCARALAHSAARGGYVVHVLDSFADADTQHWAASAQRVPWENGQTSDRISSAVVPMARALGVFHGVVYGAGFEADPGLLDGMQPCGPLLGNPSSLVARLKDPVQLAGLLRELEIPHPETRLTPPQDPRGWLCKRAGGAGGAHVRAAESIEAASSDRYFQRYREGRTVSVLFLADGRLARVVGFHEQWVNGGAGDGLYAYGGACSGSGLAPGMCTTLWAAVERLVAHTGLRGLNGLDFIQQGQDFHLIDINPRPCITLDLYDPDWPEGLFHWHVQACNGHLPTRSPGPGPVRAHRLLYATHPVTIPAGAIWPDWVTDRPAGTQMIGAGMPVCTLHAEGADRDEVMRRLDHRAAWLKGQLGMEKGNNQLEDYITSVC